MFALGNLTVKELEQRLGITFNGELKDILSEDNRQHSVDKVKKWDKDWHCFDIPFMLMLKNFDLAIKVGTLLYREDFTNFKEKISIGWHE